MVEQIIIDEGESREIMLARELMEALIPFQEIEPISEDCDMDTLPVVIAAKKLSEYYLFEDKGENVGLAATLHMIKLVYPEQEGDNRDSFAIIDHVKDYQIRKSNEMYGKEESKKLEWILSLSDLF